MSDAFIVRRGGGGLPSTEAIVHVNAPAGSTITLSKAGAVMKVLKPRNGHINDAEPSYADWYYPVSSSNYGTWTVAAECNGEGANTTITIDSNEQYDVSLNYDLYIVKDGTLQSGFSMTGDLTQQTGYVNINGATWVISVNETYGNTYGHNSGTFKTLPDVRYSYVVMECSAVKTSSECSWSVYYSGVVTSSSLGSNNGVAKTYRLSVSGQVLKDRTIRLHMPGNGNYVRITNLYLTNASA